MEGYVSAVELSIAELPSRIDLTDYTGLGLGFERIGEFVPGDYVLINILRVGKRLSPAGYLRPEPEQALLIEIDEGYVVGFDFMRERFYPEFLRSLEEGKSTLHSSYVLITDAGVTGLWFRRFPRELVSYLYPRDIYPYIIQPLTYKRVYLERAGSITSFVKQSNFGCFPVVQGLRVCIDRLRVYPDGRVAEV